MNTGDESTLLAAARAGDEQAFGRLASRHRAGLELYCRLMLGCPHDGHEAVDETLLRAWRDLHHVAPSATGRIWLYRVATDVCLGERYETDESARSRQFDGTEADER